MNIKFEYLYRDSANYKNHGEVIFGNKKGQSIEKLFAQVQSKLIDDLYFHAIKSNLPDLHFEKFDEKLDHFWHEFDNLSKTDEPTNDFKNRDILELIDELRADLFN